MIPIKPDRAAAWLRGCGRLVILFHVRPDGDAVGSAFALRAALAAVGCDVWCVCAEQVPARLRFLCCPGGDERLWPVQESVLLEDMPERFADAPVVTVDTASPAQIGSDLIPLIERCVLMIDHHESGVQYADFCIDPAAAACAELILTLIDGMQVALTTDMAACLYAALSSDTGGFRFSNVTPAVHTAAARLVGLLRDSALPPDEINRRLFASKPLSLLRGEALALANLRLFADGRVAVTTITDAERRAEGLSPADTETMVDAIRVLAGCEIAISFKQLEDSCCYRVSMRSTGPDVAHVAEKFGGGGHTRAAGCTVEAPSIDAAVEAVVAAIPMLL